VFWFEVRSMPVSAPEVVTYRLQLRDIRDLFVAPEPDPFDPCLDVSGVDELVNRISAGSLKNKAARIEIVLPPEQVTPGLEARIDEAMERHLALRRAWTHNELLATRQSGWNSMKYALLLTLIVTGLLAVVYFLNWPPWLQALAYAVFIVVAWVSLWWAVETLLFDPLEHHRLDKVLTIIGTAEVDIQPDPQRRAPAEPAAG
jgi:hypothetical protein